jgi:hypothetical protein
VNIDAQRAGNLSAAIAALSLTHTQLSKMQKAEAKSPAFPPGDRNYIFGE